MAPQVHTRKRTRVRRLSRYRVVASRFEPVRLKKLNSPIVRHVLENKMKINCRGRRSEGGSYRISSFFVGVVFFGRIEGNSSCFECAGMLIYLKTYVDMCVIIIY